MTAKFTFLLPLIMLTGCAQPPDEIQKSPKHQETCSASFTDAKTERAIYPVYFSSRDGRCAVEDAWDRLQERTSREQFHGAKFVQMGTPLSKWFRIDGLTLVPLTEKVMPQR